MIRGHLKFEGPVLVPSGQRIVISVEDTSRADADAVQVTKVELTVPDGFDGDKESLPFEIDLPDSTDTWILRAHMPRHSGADIRLDDMITTETIPVRQDADIAVTLRRVD